MSDLSNYLSQLNSAFTRRNGAAFAKLLALPAGEDKITVTHKQFVDKIRKSNIVAFCESQYSDSNTCGIIAFRLMALVSLVDGDFETGKFSCTLYSLLCNSFTYLHYSGVFNSIQTREYLIQPHVGILLNKR